MRSKLDVLWLILNRLWREKCPRAVEKYVGRELLLALVKANSCSVDPNNIANFLANGQVLKLTGEEDKCTEFDVASLLINLHT